MQDLSGKLASCTVFSRHDLVKGYHHVLYQLLILMC